MDAIDSGKLDWVFAGDLAEEGLTPDDLATLARIMSRPCPYCAAEVGAWCRTNGGTVIDRLDDQHVARRRTGPGWTAD